MRGMRKVRGSRPAGAQAKKGGCPVINMEETKREK